MTAVEHSAELAKAGANITTRWQGAMFLARHYPLGAAGAIILIVFVLTRYVSLASIIAAAFFPACKVGHIHVLKPQPFFLP